ncbi:MAG: Ni/Fe-hydrogenase cytochrome b subunit [Anaerolineae bacterium]
MIPLTSPTFWFVVLLSLGIPALFLAGTQVLTYRLVSQRRTAARPPTQAEPLLPALRAQSVWPIVRTLLLISLLGIATGLVLVRFAFGIGTVTNLSNQFPWGLWIGFDVMSGVALAAGAFVMAAAVHVFRLERFEPLVRPAILTGFLGYLLVVAGLMVDLGRPYNVWRPLVHWQHNSVMWEVGLCVATYTTVLFIEFLPIMLERLNGFPAVTRRLPTVPLYKLLKKVGIVFVIAGVVLSTLHQSSLGSLWVLMPTKLSPLWYSIWLPVFFWLSAVAVGLAMTIVEATLSARAFKRGLELPLLADLGRAAAVVLAVYLIARFADLAWRGAWPLLFEPTLQAGSFWLEIGLGVALPAVLLSFRSLRLRPNVLFGSAALVVLFGVVLNRLNVSWIGLLPYAGNIYFPSWMELVITFALVSAGVIVFGLAAKYLPVFEEPHQEPAAGAKPGRPVPSF